MEWKIKQICGKFKEVIEKSVACVCVCYRARFGRRVRNTEWWKDN